MPEKTKKISMIRMTKKLKGRSPFPYLVSARHQLIPRKKREGKELKGRKLETKPTKENQFRKTTL